MVVIWKYGLAKNKLNGMMGSNTYEKVVITTVSYPQELMVCIL
jgi:hypothetical protein